MFQPQEHTPIKSPPNVNILIPQLERERERANPQEQRRVLAANSAGPRRCRLLQWMLDRPPQRIRTDSVQAFYQEFLTHILLREDTKRILIKEQQHVDIITSQHPVPMDVARELRWPFDDHIYIETDRPIPVQEYENRTDLYQGILIMAGPEPRWSLTVMTCTPYNWLGGVIGLIDLQKNAYRVLNEDIDAQNFQPNEFNPYVRLLAYMTAKGIELVQHPTGRNTRRLLERKALPNPWHVINVEPKFLIDEFGNETPDGDRRHSYRYDVAGHIRFGRHRLKDGKHRTTKEWIRPHQRGLANSTYIPTTRRYSGKITDDIIDTIKQTPPQP